MRNIICLLVLISGTVFAGQGAGGSYYNDRERGWFWYEEPELIIEPEEKEQEQASVPVQSAPMSPREILKKQGEDWEDAMATAILDPSQENYENYLRMTAIIQQQSQDFAEGFKKSLWVTPEYDYTLQSPRNTQAIVAKNQADLVVKAGDLHRLADDNGLIFFFRSDCPYCHRFAPILKKFAGQYGFAIVPVSLDGGGLPEFPYPKPNYDLGKKLNVDVVPALFLVNPDSNKVTTVGYGYSDWSELREKIIFSGEQMNGTSAFNVGGIQ